MSKIKTLIALSLAIASSAAYANVTVARGEIGLVFKDAPSTKTRAQVAAETREARRLGLIVYGQQSTPKSTPAQEDLIRLAGERAIGNVAAVK